jgi:hypothetical protein
VKYSPPFLLEGILFGMKAVRIGIVVILTSLWLTACLPQSGMVQDETTPVRQQVEASLGIESVAIRQTSAGYMLDYRYRVLDPVLAADMLDRKIKPYLLHEATGKVLAVPVTAKVGPLRQSTLKPEAGRIYFMMFGNAGNLVQVGDKVSLIIGEHKIEHLTVE